MVADDTARPQHGSGPGPSPDLSALLTAERVAYIEQHGLRTDAPTESLDRITDIARKALGVRAATVTIVSNVQTTVASDGLELPAGSVTVSLEESFCARAMATGTPLAVRDAASHPWVAHTDAARSGRVVGYLGAPMFSEDGHALGAVCAFTDEPHDWTDHEIAVISQLAALATSKLDLQVRNAWLSKALDELEVVATQDPLTGLCNRRRFMRELDDAVAAGPAAVVAIDLDGFKEVNDRYGHGVADGVLRVVAARLTEMAPEGAVVARLGGDEFAVLLRPEGDDSCPQPVAAMIADGVPVPILVGSDEIAVGVSVGVACSGCRAGDAELSHATPEELLQAADVAMYAAKHDGGGERVYDPALHSQTQRVDAIEAGLRAAVRTGEGLGVTYQPVYALQGGALLGVEATARFLHPELGRIASREMLLVAEQRSLMRQLDTAVVEIVADQRARWHREGVDVQLLWVNLAADELAASTVISRLVGLSRTPGARLGVDVTETGLFEGQSQVHAGIETLAAAGIRVAIDNFGAGYSSLANLRGVPVQALKLDRSFLHDIGEAGANRRIIEGVVALGRALEVSVVAEGVEHPGQLACLREIGCDAVAGHLLGGPLPDGDKLRRLLTVPPSLLGGARPRR